MTIFDKEAGYAAFKEVLEQAVERTQTRLLAYCSWRAVCSRTIVHVELNVTDEFGPHAVAVRVPS